MTENYYSNIQNQNIEFSKNFVKYLYSPEYFTDFEINNIEPYEGDARKNNYWVKQLHEFNNYNNKMINSLTSPLSSSSNKEEEKREEYDDNDKILSDKEIFLKNYHNFNCNNKEEEEKDINKEVKSEDESKREIITIRGKEGGKLDVTIENYVYVTYFANRYNLNENLKFNLLHMCEHTLDLGVHYSKHKFSKNNYRFIDNGIVKGSHLLFRSMVCVETGFKEREDAKEMIKHRLHILRTRCGYPNLIIKKRQCQNVVATGTLNFSVCLNLLKARYPSIIYNRETFAGAVIKMKTLQYDKESADKEIFHEEEDNHDDEAGLDDDFLNNIINQLSSTSSSSPIVSPIIDNIKNDNDHNTITNEEDEEDEIDEDDEIDENMVDILNIIEKNNNKKPQVTILVFLRGQIIIVGNKSRNGVIHSIKTIFPMLESCRDSDKNLLMEHELVERQKRVSKKRKVQEPINNNNKDIDTNNDDNKKRKTTVILK